MPPVAHEKRASDDRRQQRSQGEYGGERRHHVRGAVALEVVAHNRPHHDWSATGGDTLKETRRDEDTDARTCGTGKRGQRIDRKATDQHPAPAKSVGQRPDDNLPRGVAEKVEAQRELDLVRRGQERCAERGQRRQRHVD